MADSDFDTISQNGKLCNIDGDVGPQEFESIMRTQVRNNVWYELMYISGYDRINRFLSN